jgi:hypothetical protein
MLFAGLPPTGGTVRLLADKNIPAMASIEHTNRLQIGAHLFLITATWYQDQVDSKGAIIHMGGTYLTAVIEIYREHVLQR